MEKKDWQKWEEPTDLWNNIERYTILIIGIPEIEEYYRAEKNGKVMVKNFPNKIENIDLWIQIAQKTPSKVSRNESKLFTS